jgi:hypothetical protein
MKTYCEHCNQRTESIFNDFMVEFCYTCKRIKRSNHRQLQTFKCIHCGIITDESYIGQTVCNSCASISEEQES